MAATTNISFYYEIHPFMESHFSSILPLSLTQIRGKRTVFGLTLAALFSCLTAQRDFIVLFLGVPSGVVSIADHVRKSISVSTSHISR